MVHSLAILRVLRCDAPNQWIGWKTKGNIYTNEDAGQNFLVFLTWVAISQQGAYREKDLGDSQGWRPVVLQDVQTDHALAVDVAVVNASAKSDLRKTD